MYYEIDCLSNDRTDKNNNNQTILSNNFATYNLYINYKYNGKINQSIVTCTIIYRTLSY